MSLTSLDVMATVAVKNVNEQVYRRVKALASLKGRTVGEVVNEALDLWVQLMIRGVSIEDWERLEAEASENNQAYEREEASLLARHRGEYVAVAGGKILGAFSKPKDAYVAVREAGFKHAIITRIEEKPKKVIEVGWSLMEQLA